MTDRDANGYLRWELAGGPNECAHGYARGIPCPKCDQSLVQFGLPAGCEVISTRRTDAGIEVVVKLPAAPSFIKVGFGFTL
jgi:hypothetical protein